MRAPKLAQALWLPPFVFTAIMAAAQNPARSAVQPSNQPLGTYRIAGTVVAISSGQPLQRATVQILSDTDRKPLQTTNSDEDGHFAFSSLPAGNYILQGSGPGYLPTEYEEHDGYTTGIITGAKVDTESLVLKLRPQGSITGTVLDEAAEPVRNAQIHLFRQSHDFGDSRIVAAGSQSTDDLGHFEFSRLASGSYLLAVTATPWYAIHPNPAEGLRYLTSREGATIAQPWPQPASGFVDSVDPTLDVAYPITYYPGVTDSSQAAPIPVSGSPVDLTLHLTPVPAISVSFPYSQPTQPGQPTFFPQMSTSIFGVIQFSAGQQYQQTGSQMVLSGLAPGDYFLSDSRQPVNQASGTPLRLDRSTTADLPKPLEFAHVRVVLKTIDAAAAPNGMLVGLIRRGTTNFITRAESKDGEAKFDVAPGDYYFSVCGDGRSCFVRLVFAGNQPLAGNNIHIASGGDLTFTVVVAIGTHTVRGITQKDGKPAPGAFLLIFPTSETPKDGAQPIRTFFRDQSDLDGSFEFNGLAPGTYTVLAIDDGWDLDWQKPAVLARYLPGAVTVHVPDSSATTQTLPAPVPIQAK